MDSQARDTRAWLGAGVAVLVIYAGSALLSVAMAFDNLDSGVRPSDEIVFAGIGTACAGLLAAPFIIRARPLPARGVLVAAVTAVSAAVAAVLLLSAYRRDLQPGQSIPASATLLRRAAVAVVALAPPVAGICVGREKRPELFVTAAALTATGWLISLAVVMIHYRYR